MYEGAVTPAVGPSKEHWPLLQSPPPSTGLNAKAKCSLCLAVCPWLSQVAIPKPTPTCHMASDLGVRGAYSGFGQPLATAQESEVSRSIRKTPGFPRALWVVMLTSGQSAHLVLTHPWTGCSYSGEDTGTFILLLSCFHRSLFRQLLHPHLPYSQRSPPVPEECPGQLRCELVSKRSAQGLTPKAREAQACHFP